MSSMGNFEGIFKNSRKSIMKTNAILAAVVAVIEIGVFGVLDLNIFTDTTKENDRLIHHILPFLFILLVMVCASLLLHSWRIKEQVKNSIPIFVMVLICFIFSVSHSNYPELLGSFSIPVLVTVLYCNQWISGAVFLLSLIAQQIAIVILIRDESMEAVHLVSKAIISGLILILAYISVRTLLYFENQKKTLLSESIQKQSQLEEELMTDGLTTLYNHRAFQELLKQCVEDANTEERQVLLAVVDIDDFKQINDDYGHEQGNLVLSRLGKVIRNHCGAEGIAARYGGEEFAVIFRDLEPFYAIDRMKKILHTFHAIKFVRLNGRKVSFSCGIVSYKKGQTPHEFFHHADLAMYEAKKQGKNCVIYER